MPGRDWNLEELTEDEAQFRHPGCALLHAHIFDLTGKRRAVILVFNDLDVDEAEPLVVYWLRPASNLN